MGARWPDPMCPPAARVGEAPRRRGLTAPAAHAGALTGLLAAGIGCALAHDHIAAALTAWGFL